MQSGTRQTRPRLTHVTPDRLQVDREECHVTHRAESQLYVDDGPAMAGVETWIDGLAAVRNRADLISSTGEQVPSCHQHGIHMLRYHTHCIRMASCRNDCAPTRPHPRQQQQRICATLRCAQQQQQHHHHHHQQQHHHREYTFYLIRSKF